MNDTVFSNITIKDGTSIRIYAFLENKCFDLTILKEGYAWKKVLHSGDLEAIASAHELNLEEYSETLIDYLKCSNPSIEHNLSNNEFVISRILESGLKVKYFACRLYKANYVEISEEILDKFYSKNVESSKKLDETLKRCEEYKQHQEACELKLKDLLERKKSHDDELFNYFMLIVNEKKARLRELSELLNDSENGDLLVKKASTKRKERKRKEVVISPKTTKKEVVSDSESEKQQDTDEEIEMKNNCENNMQGQSTSILEMLDQCSSFKDADNIATQDSRDDESTSLLDIFFDAPSTSGLHKRQRIDQERNIEVLVMPKVPTEKKEVPLEPDKKGSKTPVVELNTQQLLDML